MAFMMMPATTRKDARCDAARRTTSPGHAERPKSSTSSVPLDAPFVILIDSAEKAPFTFTTLRADAAQLRRPLVVRTVRRHIRLGTTRLSIDYSIEGLEAIVGIERKSHEDFCNTLAGKHRDRFEKKLAIINATFAHFAVVIEAEWSTIIREPPPYSAAVPKVLFRTVIAWMTRYPRVHWVMMAGREMAEQATYRILERWWKELGTTATVPAVSKLPPPPQAKGERL